MHHHTNTCTLIAPLSQHSCKKRSLMNPLAPLVKLGEGIISAFAGKGPGAGPKLEDQPRLTNAILKYHTRSIVQSGITSLYVQCMSELCRAISL